jgi:transposase
MTEATEAPDARPSRRETDARIVALHREGLLYREITARTGVPYATVRSSVLRLQNAGVLPRRARDRRFV